MFSIRCLFQAESCLSNSHNKQLEVPQEKKRNFLIYKWLIFQVTKITSFFNFVFHLRKRDFVYVKVLSFSNKKEIDYIYAKK